MIDPLPDFIRLAQAIKASFLDRFEDGDGPPYLMIERGGAIPFLILTTARDIHHAIPALRCCYSMIPHDSLLLVHEARMKVEHARPGRTKDEAFADFCEQYVHGSYDQLARAGKAGEHGIVDCVLVSRVFADKAQVMYTLPYLYSGPGTPFHWLPSQFLLMGSGTDNPVSGKVAEAIAYACSGATLADLLATLPECDPAEAHRREQLQVATTLHFLEAQRCTVLTAASAYGSLLP